MIYVITILGGLGWYAAFNHARRYRELHRQALAELARLDRTAKFQQANAEYWKGQVDKLRGEQ